MRRNIIHSIAFLLVLLLLLSGASSVFLPKNNTTEAGIHDLDANSILAEPENTIDVLFLGDSEAYCAFVPMRLWKNTGITAYVCSSVDQKLYETEAFLHTAFQKQSPKIVVLETNVLYRVYPFTDTIGPAVQARLPVFRYHDRWKSLTPADFTTSPSRSYPCISVAALRFSRSSASSLASFHRRLSIRLSQLIARKSRFTPGAIFAAIMAASMGNVPPPQKGSTRIRSLRQGVSMISAAASVSVIGALAV